MDATTLAEWIGPAAGAAALLGVGWRVVSWHNELVAKIDQYAADAKHQHELQADQIDHLRADLGEFKEESRRNFTTVFDQLKDMDRRLSRLEGKSE